MCCFPDSLPYFILPTLMCFSLAYQFLCSDPYFSKYLHNCVKFLFSYSIIIMVLCFPNWTLTSHSLIYILVSYLKFQKSPKCIVIWGLIRSFLELAWTVWLTYLHDTDSWSRSERYWFTGLCCAHGSEEFGGSLYQLASIVFDNRGTCT